MPNVSSQQFMPRSTGHAQLGQPFVRMNKSLALSPSPSAESVNKFLKDSSPAAKEDTVTVNKESLEKLFALFEFAVKAMRSLLVGMGQLPKVPTLPDELDAQHQMKPGSDARVVTDADAHPKVMSGVDAKPQAAPGPEMNVMPDGKARVSIAPGGKLNTKLTSDINLTVQVQHCHCPHTDEDVAQQPRPALKVDTQPSPQPLLTPKIVDSLPDFTHPAPHDLGDFNRHSQGRSGNPQTDRPRLRSRV